MEPRHDAVDKIIEALQERAKELNCLYQVDELVNRPEASLDEVCRGLLETIPPGWQYPSVCWVRITLERRRLPAPARDGDPVGPGGAHRRAGRDGRAARGVLHAADAEGRRGAVPQGGAAAHRHDRRAPRSLPDAAPPAEHAAELAVGRREPRHPRAARVVGHHRVPPQDRPAAAHAHRAPDDQPPLLERRRGGAAVAAPLRLRPAARPTTGRWTRTGRCGAGAWTNCSASRRRPSGSRPST